MNIYPVNITTQEKLRAVCAKIGADDRALAYLAPKFRVIHLYADNMDYRAAGFLKQEMLARGGDTIVTKHVIDGKTDKSDILIMATPSQLKSLQEKLKAMDIWGLKEFREKLSKIVQNMNVHEWVMHSPTGHKITLNMHTQLMAILNLTPDSFFAHSRIDEKGILSRAEKCLTDGAYILDLGAESTRPGAEAVSESEELGRLLPALRLLRGKFPDALISIDTYKPEVARISAHEGADMINDISGFTFGGNMPEVIAALKIPYVLSHITGTPENMRSFENHADIVRELAEYFAAKIAELESAGVERENIILDPGLGFGKNSGDNFAVIRDIESLSAWGLPVMAGHSRKRFTGDDRLAGSVALSAVLSGRVSLLRVHDVKENMQALRIAREVMN